MTPSEPSRSRLPFVALVAADNTSRFGDLMTAVVIPWFVLETTGSAGKTGVVVFAIGIAVVVSLFGGGAIVDRVGYRRMSILGDAASASTVAAIAVLHYLDALPFEALVALAFLGTLLDLPAGMARYATLPDAAESAGLTLERANSLYEGVISTGALVAPATAGFLIAAVGPANVLWFDVASFTLSIAIVAIAFPGQPSDTAEARLPLRDALAQSWSLIRRDEVLFPLVTFLFLINLVIGPVETLIIPVYASDVLDSAIALGLMTAALAIGGLGGNLLFGAIGHRLPRQLTFTLAFLPLPIGLLLLAPGPGVALVLPILAAVGLGLSVGNLLEYTIYFERIPAHIRASVLGICGGLTWLSVPLGRLAVGGLLETWSLERTLVVVGLVALPLPFVALALRGRGSEDDSARNQRPFSPSAASASTILKKSSSVLPSSFGYRSARICISLTRSSRKSRKSLRSSHQALSVHVFPQKNSPSGQIVRSVWFPFGSMYDIHALFRSSIARRRSLNRSTTPAAHGIRGRTSASR